VGEKTPTLFKPAAAWRVRSTEYTDTPLPPDEPMGENPPDGAIMDYNLSANAQEVTLEVLGRDGKVLRRYSSKDPVTPTPEQMKTNLIPPYWPQVHGPMPVTAGMHRWFWDLRSTTPTATHYEYPISAVPYRTPLEPQGPLVLPGSYTVRLTVDGHSESQTLMVKMDPRVQTAPSDLEALHTAQLTMADTLDEVAKADLAAHAVAEQIASPQNASLSAKLAPFGDTLKALLSGDPGKHVPGVDQVNGEVGQLYEELEQADGVPTEALMAAAAHAEAEATEVVRGWEDFREHQLPALNKLLDVAHHARIDLAKPPRNLPDEGDED
jgi:hypothetical protein